MKDNTKVRLHLSKQLFESLTKQVLAEGKKNYGTGMEEVKGKKHGMKKPMKEMEMEVAEEGLDESVLTDPSFIAGLATLLGGGTAIVSALMKDLKGAKTPEEKAEVLRSAASSIESSKGVANENLDEAGGVEYAWIPAAAGALGIGASMMKGILAYMKKNDLKGMKGFMQAAKAIGSETAGSIERSKGV